MNINWKSEQELPEENGVVGLLWCPADPEIEGDVPFFAGLYLFGGGTWQNEETMEEPDAPFFWMLEAEFSASLPAMCRVGAQEAAPEPDLRMTAGRNGRTLAAFRESFGDAYCAFYAQSQAEILAECLKEWKLWQPSDEDWLSRTQQAVAWVAMGLDLLRPILGGGAVGRWRWRKSRNWPACRRRYG
jgi:hypothetical protein